MKVGVVVGRFQGHYLHDGHAWFIKSALKDCDRLIIFVGTSIVRSESNPLPFFMVKQSLQSIPGTSEVYELKDKKTNEQWVDNLISKVGELTSEDDDIYFYGSRDSFLPTLPDFYNKVEIEELPNKSGTELRNSISYENDRWFRAGYIKAIQDEFNAHFTVVDAIITDGENILLGKKESGYCIIGGFADDQDSSLEEAIIREVKEETGLTVSNPKYLTSSICKDWRYLKYRQPFTSAFVVEVENFNGAVACDDIDEIVIVPLNRIEDYLSEGSLHLRLVKKYIQTR